MNRSKTTRSTTPDGPRRLFVYTAIALLTVSVMFVWQRPALMSSHGTAAAAPSLRGAEAVEHLRTSGQYDSLVDAVKAVSARDSGANDRSPNDAFSLQTKVVASQPEFFSFFGESVAISGSTAIVGALNQTVNGNTFQGAAYIFVRSGNRWVEQEMLVAADGAANDRFGYSVAIDGERAIVGAADDTVDGVHDQGSAYVFVRSGTVWNQEAKLTGDVAGGDEFGSSVAISGLTVVVGSRGDITGAGAAYVFIKSTTWTRQQKLVANDGMRDDAFGFQRAVAISGETIIVGARFAKVGSNESQGAAYIFTRSGSTWTQQQKITAPDGVAYAEFGVCVAISGETAIVGAWRDNVGGEIRGSAYVYYRSGISWIFDQKLTASDGQVHDRFGRSVGIDGETAIVGLEKDSFSNDPGAAYIFVRGEAGWEEQQRLSAPEIDFNDRYGSSVALDAGTAIVGAVMDSVTHYDQGSAYIYGSGGTTVSPPEQIAFSSDRDGNDEIYVMDPDGSNQTRITQDPASDVGPSFSADESLVVFSSTRDGNAEIYIMNADGSNPIRLTDNAAADSHPSFSRDGLRVVFTSDRDGNDEIYSMKTDGSSQTRLTNDGLSDTAPAFSPSGQRVVFERLGADGNRDIYIMNANGTGQTRLTTAAGDDGAASFSRDGSRIAFASTRNGNNEIYVMDADGTDQTRVTNNASLDTEPSYSPDNSKIAFRSDRDGNSEIYTMNADGTGPSRLTDNSSVDDSPDWGGFVSPSTAGRISAADGLARDFFGTSVAISGNTAIVGATGVDFGQSSSPGAAYVFVRIGGTWVEQQRLVADDAADSDEFGWSVAISGETAVVGARSDDLAAGFDQGSAYVFVRNGTTWTQQQKLTASDAANSDTFGWSVAVSGETIVVGSNSDDIAGSNNQGSAYVFVRNGALWTEQQQLTAADGTVQDNFGSSVAISGETVIVGSFNDDVAGNSNQGSAYIFVRNGTTWTQQQQLTADDGAVQDNFGFSVGISGETAVIGAIGDDVGADADQGSAYTFVRNGTLWTQQQKLTGDDGAPGDFLGWSVAISGETVIAGAPSADATAVNQGAAYTFVRNGPLWAELQKVTAPDAAANNNFGTSVAIDGETAIAGAPNKTVGTNAQQGAAYIFLTVLPPPPTPTPSPTPTTTPEPNTPAGPNISVRLPEVKVTFSLVTAAGQTTFHPISPDDAGTLPAGYAMCRSCPAYDITTTAAYTPPVDVCLSVPTGLSAETFGRLSLMHGEAGTLTDRTTGRFTDEDGDRSVCGSVSSLSPFVLAETVAGTPSPTPTATSTPHVQHVLDLNGDGKTDLGVTREQGTGLVWYINDLVTGTGADITVEQLGGVDDIPITADFDGDAKTDIGVWRPDEVQSNFSILESSTGTIRTVYFGKTGDDPTVVGDYDGDGKADVAVFRQNGTAADPCGTGNSVWYYEPSGTPAIDLAYSCWGQSGDLPAPADYDGDGRFDPTVRRAESGQGVFYRQMTTSGVDVQFFGISADTITPGDYDGDGRGDIAVVRNEGGHFVWYYKPSSAPATAFVSLGVWGEASTDVLAQGDYDGDGRTDRTVWRPDPDPAQNYFYIDQTSAGMRAAEWGQQGDVPVASYINRRQSRAGSEASPFIETVRPGYRTASGH